MVESQIRPSDVTDRRITAAMSAVPREIFLPDRLAKFAYSDEALNVGSGAVMLPPSVLARLVQLADIDAGDTVLVIGGSVGYTAAIVAQIAKAVVALLPDSKAAAAAANACRSTGTDNVTTAAGALAEGWKEQAPYAAIVVEGGVEAIPEALKSQLAQGGRLVAIEVERGLGHAFLLQKNGELLVRRDAFQAAAPLLPGFESPKPAFVF
ncbi:protein-L-isoaspartate(D-aspartate) O-methyltransferase [Hyphomicrobium denitrificans 1NES1]|uniref:Protein-L-isoaspartate O-methyltransferase n=2 Tax=Hyphomicrobium denitrificans TaxID=53399 RepID=N0BBP0_9HYPH|nr:protein-L-isoaspartate(D-aspartate) O-methyltransferase [Hyphomicrobium denitrificans 1NES1]